jgi:hypothetical protein
MRRNLHEKLRGNLLQACLGAHGNVIGFGGYLYPEIISFPEAQERSESDHADAGIAACSMIPDPRPPLDLLHPYDASKMKMVPANPAVGNWRNNGPEMLDPP